MAQIFGYISQSPGSPLRDIIASMGRLQQRAGQGPAHTWIDADNGVGVGALLDREQGWLAPISAGGPMTGAWLLDGEIYRAPAAPDFPHRPAASGQRAAADAASAGASDRSPASREADRQPGLAAGIPALYARHGSDFVSCLDGSFCVALYDSARKRLILANDRFATRTMYWTRVGGAFAFATELKGLLAISSLSLSIDPATLSQCFWFNRVLGERTLLTDVRRLPPATLIEYDIASDTLHRRRYWCAADAVRERRPLSPPRLDDIVAAFEDAVRVRTTTRGRVGVSLSGGVDSRAIVAVLARQRRPALTCTTGLEGCADQRAAQRIARLTSMAHHFYALRKSQIERYTDALRAAIYSTDGMVLIGGFPAGLTERFCDEQHIDILLRGHGGENARLADAWPFPVTDAVLSMERTAFAGFLRQSLRTAPAHVDWARLFPDATTRPSSELADASLAALLAEFPTDLTPAEVMNLLYLAENDGSGPPATRNALRTHAEMGVPYLDYPFMSLILGTEARARRGPAIHHAVIARNSPDLMRVPNSNTGAPLSASGLRLLVTDKANGLMRRWQLPGYRHYHYMELWLKEFLAEQVRAIALDERTLSRGLYDRAYLTSLVDRGRADASVSRLLNLVVNLEIWFRLFCDGEAHAMSAA